MTKNTATRSHSPVLASALELLIRQGYSATTVEELADAAGVSRSTFFRKFGSKEDMVFADHERLLRLVEADLRGATAEPLVAITQAVLMVFDQHVRNRDTSLLRNRLLHQVPILRDRELVTTHRYEREFRRHLQAALPEENQYGAAAFAAAAVAVHNRVLLHWFLEAGDASDARLDRIMAAKLDSELRSLSSIFRPALFPDAAAEPDRPSVVVTVLDPSAGTDCILQAVREALR